MFEQILPIVACVGLVVLAILCLPVVRKFVLEISALVLRLAMLALLAGGAYLWFRPDAMPAGVSRVFDTEPWLLTMLPDRSSAYFGICAAYLVVLALLPLLAALDVTRRLAGRRLRRLCILTDELVAVAAIAEPAAEVVETPPEGVPVMRPVQRRTAANAIAAPWSRGPSRYSAR